MLKVTKLSDAMLSNLIQKVINLNVEFCHMMDIMLYVDILSGVMLNVVMLINNIFSVVELSVIILNVVAAFFE
jgi:hypothetical protein